MTTTGYLLHRTTRRVRVHVPSARGDADSLAAIGRRLMASERIVRYEANPLTGSFLAETSETSSLGLLEDVTRLGEVDLRPADSFDPTGDVTALTLSSLRGLGAASLVTAAAFQARRGKLFPAGLTLLFQGWDLMRASAAQEVGAVWHEG